jgi:hypothetical protein
MMGKQHGDAGPARGRASGRTLLMRRNPLPAGRTMESMICVPCRKHHHDDCPGGTWCDCQHQPSVVASSDVPMNWVRQG